MDGQKPFSILDRVNSFRYAFHGLFDIIRTEHNAWIHSVTTVVVIGLSIWLRIDTIQFCFIVLAITAVWVAEAFNTVLEIVVDIASPQYSHSAKRAKDIAAAAVLMAAIGAITLGIVILGPPLAKKIERKAYAAEETAKPMTLSSSAFQGGTLMPKKFTCEGANISPPLEWTAPPPGTQSLALIVDDPDTSRGTWTHWILFNLPPTVSSLSEGISVTETLENGGVNGMPSFKKLGYGGPCPPKGTHRYFFKLYALDKKLDLKPGATKKQLLKAMKGHVLAKSELVGKYKRGMK